MWSSPSRSSIAHVAPHRVIDMPDEESTDDELVEITLEFNKADSLVMTDIVPCNSIPARAIKRFNSLSLEHVDRTQSGARHALKGLRFINRAVHGPAHQNDLWQKVEEHFDSLSKDGLLSRDDFGECIGMVDSKEFAVGIFDALARRQQLNMQSITKEELHEFWLKISDQSFDARLQIFFDMVDTNTDGRISKDDVQELICLSASANHLTQLNEKSHEFAAMIMEELDPENLGYIESEQLEAVLLQKDSFYSRPISTISSTTCSRNLSTASGHVFGDDTGPPSGRRIVSNCKHQIWSIFRSASNCWAAVTENKRQAWVIVLWLAVMATLFGWKFTQYKNSAAFQVMGYCLTTAKGAAETLKFNMSLVLFPVCRNTLTWLRSTRLRYAIPFDDNISFHKMIAAAIVIGAILHVGNHLACDFPRILVSSPEKYGLIAQYFGHKKPTYLDFIKGVEGVTGILMVILMLVVFTLASRPFRKNGTKLPFPFNRMAGFNTFWFSHHLLMLVYVLLLVHGYYLYLTHNWYQKTTWMYISIPLLLYMGERILGTFRSKYSAKILKVSLLPGNVLTLTIAKPQGFRYRSGQYVFLQCAHISPFEWHPFSITSAPSDEVLSVHIKAAGDWTRELMRIFVDKYVSVSTARSESQPSLESRSLPKLVIDGPYGAPAQDYRNYDVLLLVGLGIGATPFVSILRDLLNKTRFSNDESIDQDGTKKGVCRTQDAYFYWVTRDPNSFEWFKGVMNEVADMDKKGVIELHNYLTSVYEERDARSTFLALLQAMHHAKHGVDIVSGVPVRTHFARPRWKDVFSKVATKHPNKTIGVFYCGPSGLAKELRKLSYEMSSMTSTRFNFHKEYF